MSRVAAGRARDQVPKSGKDTKEAKSKKDFLASSRRFYGQKGAGNKYFVVCHFAGDIKCVGLLSRLFSPSLSLSLSLSLVLSLPLSLSLSLS